MDMNNQPSAVTDTNANNAPNGSKPAISIDSVLSQLQEWRSKKSPHERIPDSIWRQIFTLADHFPSAQMRAVFALSTSQYNAKLKKLLPQQYDTQTEAKAAKADPGLFYEVKTNSPGNDLYQPLEIPNADTIIAEFSRKDGQVMKIHTTSANFKTLLKLFMEHGHRATDHC